MDKIPILLTADWLLDRFLTTTNVLGDIWIHCDSRRGSRGGAPRTNSPSRAPNSRLPRTQP